ncbi:MAG: PSD1 domain-containing protein [Acidobacteria bacterium]|nr:PSD1 domain-containing protein [Acidobacteriota bacterium]
MNAYNRTRKLWLLMFAAALAGAAFWANAKVSADNIAVSFNRDIRPVFSDTCFRCHGPDKNARKAGLRLDVRAEATKKSRSGATPIVPGKPDESEIVRRIFSTDKSELMPPEDAHKTLTAEQKELIRRWVAEGAKYEGHWAYQPITRPSAPEISNLKSEIRNPIDAFIQSRLAKESLIAAPEADRRTLIRRVSLDLTGIPPTPAEVAAFVADKSPDAYEKLVDRLLASPRYAEKQTMHWLDAVRYADTSGFHGDNAFPTWPYRDYVLRSFLDNKPFDQFTREQIAGDLLPNATTEQKIASAYNRLNRVSAEGGLQPKEYLAKYAADRVRTTSITWLGATMGCAECHDHKFDPYLAKDFYSMKAFFADIKETGLVPDRGRAAWGSKLEMPSEVQKRRFDELTQALKWAQIELDSQAERLSARRAEWEKQTLQLFEAKKLTWQFQRPVSATATNGVKLSIYNDQPITVTQYRGGNIVSEEIKGDGLVVAEGENPDNATYTVTFKPGAGEWTALGVEVVQDESLPANRVARGADRFVLTEVEAFLGQRDGVTEGMRDGGIGGQSDRGKEGQNKSLVPSVPPSLPLSFTLATTDGAGQWPENHAMNAIDGNAKTGWGFSFADGRGAFIALRLAQKLKTDSDSVVTVRLRHDSELRRATIGRFRLALSSAEHSWPDHQAKMANPLNGLPLEVASALKEKPEARTELHKKNILTHFKWAAPELQPLAVRIAKLEAERDLLDSQIPRVLISESVTPMETRILPRGNFLDESGQVVTPAIPAVFGKVGTDERRLSRIDLADWIVSRENPLTARVFVNRLWRQFFGTGLTKTLDDLGSQGEWPTHPELLDWLASEFLHPSDCGSRIADCGKSQPHDWDVKHIIRLIVTSHTYRQSSNPQSAIHNPQSDDPDNRLLARQNRFRVEAETVRDIALSVSGLLVEKFGGASVKPVQPDRYLGTLNFPVRDYSADRGESLYRRGLYVHWQRTFLHPSLSAFDAPSREECTVNRVNSNTPLQALVMLNDPSFVEAARVFAQNALKQGGLTPASQIAWAFERASGRKPTAEEARVLAELYQKNLTGFQRDTDGARELANIGDAAIPKELNATRLAAMTTVTRAILNLHETITRN